MLLVPSDKCLLWLFQFQEYFTFNYFLVPPFFYLSFYYILLFNSENIYDSQPVLKIFTFIGFSKKLKTKTTQSNKQSFIVIFEFFCGRNIIKWISKAICVTYRLNCQLNSVTTFILLYNVWPFSALYTSDITHESKHFNTL